MSYLHTTLRFLLVLLSVVVCEMLSYGDDVVANVQRAQWQVCENLPIKVGMSRDEARHVLRCACVGNCTDAEYRITYEDSALFLEHGVFDCFAHSPSLPDIWVSIQTEQSKVCNIRCEFGNIKFRSGTTFDLASPLPHSVGLADSRLLASTSAGGVQVIGSVAPKGKLNFNGSDLAAKTWDGQYASGKTYIVVFFDPTESQSRLALFSLDAIGEEVDKKRIEFVCVSNRGSKIASLGLAKQHSVCVSRKNGVKFAFARPQDVCSKFVIGFDPQEIVFQQFLGESHGRNIRLPYAFLIGETGVVEWHGDPHLLRTPVLRLVNGHWNRSEFHNRQLAESTIMALHHRARTLWLKEQDPRGLTDAIEMQLAACSYPDLMNKLLLSKALILMRQADVSDTSEFLSSLDCRFPRVDLAADIAWSILESAGELASDQATLTDFAALLTKLAKSNDPFLLDAISRIQELRNLHASAIDFQLKGIAHAPESLKHYFRKRLLYLQDRL